MPSPLLMDGFLVRPRISVDQPAAGSATRSVPPLGFAFAVIATGAGH